MSPLKLTWWNRSERTRADEQTAVALREKMERILRELEVTVERMRRALEEEDEPEGGNGHERAPGS